MAYESQRTYRLGHDYRDSGSVSEASDEFLHWINVPGSGMKNMSGIRPLKFTHMRPGVPACIILLTSTRSGGSYSNPWEDLIDLPHGRIVYWGDAKYDQRRGVEGFFGNRALQTAYEQILDNRLPLVPPILHFTKHVTGRVKFNGLCVLDRLDLTWFEDHGYPVRNYRAQLTVLNEAEIPVDWLHRRIAATSQAELSNDGPRAWRRYQSGIIDRLAIWAPNVRPPESQLPPASTPDGEVLSQLTAMSPVEFESAVVTLFGELDEVRHEITRTKPTGDGGFDFFGKFTLPPPLRYEIDFLGEAKKFGRQTAVSPQHVSRLVARLGRGQYGVFVTTSYFSRQAQEEVLSDGYPVTLLAGTDLVRMMRELRVAHGSEISPAWLRAVESEMGSAPWRSA